jgi:DNA-binding NarL/FixJ family response regulator
MSGLEGTYRSGDSLKRKQEVLERVRAGIGVKQIAADLGIERHTVAEIIENLRAEGEAPTTEIRPS